MAELMWGMGAGTRVDTYRFCTHTVFKNRHTNLQTRYSHIPTHALVYYTAALIKVRSVSLERGSANVQHISHPPRINVCKSIKSYSGPLRLNYSSLLKPHSFSVLTHCASAAEGKFAVLITRLKSDLFCLS